MMRHHVGMGVIITWISINRSFYQVKRVQFVEVAFNH